MSIDSKQDSSNNNDLKTDEKSSSEISVEHKDDNQLNSSTTFDLTRTSSRSNSSKIIRSNSPKITRSQSHTTNSSEEKQLPKITDEIIIQRPLSPVTRHREIKQQTPILINRQRARSNSPRKTFSYLPPDRLNFRAWKQQHRQIAKQDEYNRIYYENRLKLERLAKIAKEPSSYPTIHIEQERQRERHTIDHRRKVLKSYIPVLQDNLCIVNRLANIKGVYDNKKMHEEYNRHTQILKQDAANRKKARETAAQRPFILPKINLKS